ncbi:hypothetical protein MMC17_002831 [Xylographa soralifera]|nr:hypothetical protein [Xylographa soralifera]
MILRSKSPILTLCGAILVFGMSLFGSAAADIVTPPSPLDTSSIQTSIQCYSLPYGAIGFLSHILTYKTILCLTFSHSPWIPCMTLTHYKLDATLGFLSLISAGILSLVAIVRCRFSWPFMLLIAWKLLLSVTLACMTMHRAYEVSQGNIHRGQITKKPGFWLIAYGFGMLLGVVGLFDILIKVWPTRSKKMEIITGAFAAAIGIVALLGALRACCTHAKDVAGWYAFLGSIGAGGVLAALYCDWILAAIEVQGGGNWWGFPSGDIAAIYWSYFVAKRLPFFAI